MVIENTESRLVSEYEAIRRREYTLITDVLEVLPRINNISEEYAAQARDALFHADHPFLMVFVGPFNAGKSSLINALVGSDDLLSVGPVPTTDRINILRWGEEPQRMNSGGDVDTVFHPTQVLKKVSLVDTPGLESIFQKHEDITRKFLHRSDVVLLVMLATQAMTARNVEYIEKLREYGKKIIIVINQADLLSPEEKNTVREYVLDQSQSRLGFKPPVWMVSAKQGLAAQKAMNEEQWRASGMNQFEDYINTQLGDVERLRQKLQTPLQIVQNVNTAALSIVKTNQAVLDQYQSIRENVAQQLSAQRREQEKTVREIRQEVSDKFGAVTMRGSEAIREIFNFSNALRSVFRGLAELTGLARLFRRGAQPSYVRMAFERHKVFEPISELQTVVNRLGPRLEGRDVQDIDDLTKYAQREIKALPETIREKVIGAVQAPIQYDRRMLQDMRPDLEKIEDEARVLETEKISQQVRSSIMYLALWEVLLVIILAILLVNGEWTQRIENLLIILMVFLGLGMLGLVLLPLGGRLVENRYTNRLLKLQNQFQEILAKAADQQVEYGMRLRSDVVAPLTRLIEAQTQIHTEQLSRLKNAEQEMGRIESDLNKLGKKSFFGLR